MRPSNVFAVVLALLVLAMVGYVLYETLWLGATWLSNGLTFIR